MHSIYIPGYDSYDVNRYKIYILSYSVKLKSVNKDLTVYYSSALSKEGTDEFYIIIRFSALQQVRGTIVSILLSALSL